MGAFFLTHPVDPLEIDIDPLSIEIDPLEVPLLPLPLLTAQDEPDTIWGHQFVELFNETADAIATIGRGGKNIFLSANRIIKPIIFRQFSTIFTSIYAKM